MSHLVIGETVASGKPVTGTRVGVILEVTLGGETAFLVDRRDELRMAEKILFLGNAELRKEREGRPSVEVRFDL